MFVLKVNELSTSITKNKVFPNYRPSAKHTGEMLGVEYLYSQLGATLTPTDSNIDAGCELVELDEGLGDEELGGPVDPNEVIVALPECEDMEEVNAFCLSFHSHIH